MRKVVLITVVLFGIFGAWTALAQDGVPLVTGLDILDRADAAFQNGDYQQAIREYSLFILLNPTVSQPYYNRALSYLQLSDADTALADLTTAMTLPSPSPDFTGQLYTLRAALYSEQGDDEAALNDLAAGIEAAPEFAGTYFFRGVLFAEQERYEEALDDFDTAIRLNPDMTDAYSNRALIHVQLGHVEEATSDYSHLIEVTPDDPALYAARATLYTQQENDEAALSDLDRAIELNDTSAFLYLQRGSVHARLGHPTEAAGDFLNYIRQNTTEVKDPLVLRPGESLVLEMEAGLVYDLRFEGSAGQTVTLTASARPGLNTDPLLILLDQEGNALAGDDDSGGNYDAAITDFALPADGVYSAGLTHAGGGADGPVRVLLTFGE